MKASPRGKKRKGAILMEQQKMLMEKMLQTLEQLSMEDLRKVYAFIRGAAGDKARIKKTAELRRS